VAQPVEEMGRVAVDVLLDKILNGEDAFVEDKVFLKTQLVARASSAKA
jgi:DNA-binding LacI/PurR family transcriptional regulator